MNLKTLSLLLFAVLFIQTTSFSQVKWEKLGSRAVNYGLDRDVIPVGVTKGGFTKLKVEVTNGSLNMHKMIIEYGNGTSEIVPLRHRFMKGSESRIIDIQGGKRIIRKITFVYDTKNLARSKAVVHVFGRH